MKDLRSIENLIRNFLKSRRDEIQTTPEFDTEVLDSASRIQQENIQSSPARRIDMRKVGVAAAFLMLLAVGIGVWLFHRMEMPAYASEIMQAIRKVETVHMMVEFYNQGEFEVWMRFNGDPDSPSHFWMQDPEGTLISKIGSPSGAFLLNPRTHRALLCSRDERTQGWIIKFGSFFEDIVGAAKWNNAVKIKWQSASEDPIEIRIETPKRMQEFLVDPKTRLPMQFTTVRDDDPGDMIHQTLAVKNIRWIRYNQEPPPNIFDLPKDAVVVEKEEDCIIGPSTSIVSDGMSPQEASMEITSRAAKAFVEMDWDLLGELGPMFRLPFYRNEGRQRKAAGHWPDRYEIKGIATQEGNYWHVPVQFRSNDGKTDLPVTFIIKFYQFEGKTYCTIVDWKGNDKDKAHTEADKPVGIYSGGINEAFNQPNPLYTFPDGDEKTRYYVEAVLKKFRKGLDPASSMKSDRDLTEEDVKSRTTIYIYGSPESHRLFQRFRHQLPILFESDGIVVGNKKCLGRDVGAIFVCPNPLNPTNRLVIYGAVSPEAVNNMNAVFHGPTDYIIFNQTTRQSGEGNPSDHYLLIGAFDKSDPAHWRVDEKLQSLPPEPLRHSAEQVVVPR